MTALINLRTQTQEHDVCICDMFKVVVKTLLRKSNSILVVELYYGYWQPEE